jgi:hypothetical protein
MAEAGRLERINRLPSLPLNDLWEPFRLLPHPTDANPRKIRWLR